MTTNRQKLYKMRLAEEAARREDFLRRQYKEALEFQKNFYQEIVRIASDIDRDLACFRDKVESDYDKAEESDQPPSAHRLFWLWWAGKAATTRIQWEERSSRRKFNRDTAIRKRHIDTRSQFSKYKSSQERRFKYLLYNHIFRQEESEMEYIRERRSLGINETPKQWKIIAGDPIEFSCGAPQGSIMYSQYYEAYKEYLMDRKPIIFKSVAIPDDKPDADPESRQNYRDPGEFCLSQDNYFERIEENEMKAREREGKKQENEIYSNDLSLRILQEFELLKKEIKSAARQSLVLLAIIEGELTRVGIEIVEYISREANGRNVSVKTIPQTVEKTPEAQTAPDPTLSTQANRERRRAALDEKIRQGLEKDGWTEERLALVNRVVEEVRTSVECARPKARERDHGYSR